MDAAGLKERADAYATILAAWTAERDAHQRAADDYTTDIDELTTYHALMMAQWATQWGVEKYHKSRRRAGKPKGSGLTQKGIRRAAAKKS